MTECEGLDDSAITCQKRLDRCSPDNFGTIPRPALLIKIDPSWFSGQFFLLSPMSIYLPRNDLTLRAQSLSA